MSAFAVCLEIIPELRNQRREACLPLLPTSRLYLQEFYMRYAFGLAIGLASLNTVSGQTQPPTAPPKPPANSQGGTPQTGQRAANSQSGARPYPRTIYQMNDVGKSLNLTADQVTRLNALTTLTQNKFDKDFTGLSTLNDAERFNRQHELRSQYYTEWNNGAKNIFNDNQFRRYQQLNYQYDGFDNFYDPNIQKQLNMTPDQVKNLREHWDWNNQQLADIEKLNATDPAKANQEYTKYWTLRQERLNRYLNAEQQKAWQEMIGEPYAFQPYFNQNR